MAKLSVESILGNTNRTSTQQGNSIGFFSLKNDGDEAIVRIMYDDVESIVNDGLSVHDVKIDGKFRQVNCLRDAKEPLDSCPLCKSGAKHSNKIFVKLIEYVRDEQGNVVGLPKVWTRTASFGKTLASYLNEYGPLSECIFKIKRRGAAGSMDTKYDVMFCNPSVYRNDIYTKIDGAFDNFNPLGRFVLDKSKEEIDTFIATGSFPMKETAQTTQVVETPSVSYPAPAVAPDDFSVPFETTNTQAVDRPVRYY